MKHLIFFLSLTFIPSTLVNAQPNDKQRFGLFGPVQFVQEEAARLEPEFGRLVEGPRRPVQNLSFDREGNVIEQSMHTPDGSLRSRVAWGKSYDSDGKETEREYYNAERRLTSKGVFTYDDSGRKNRLTHYHPGGSVNHYQLYTYDDKGNMIEEKRHNPNGALRSRVSYKYDENGRQTEAIYYMPDGTVSQRNVFTYDEQGNKSGWALYDGAGVVQIRAAYKYDSRGNVIAALNEGTSSTTKATYRYAFDSVGNWIQRVTVREVSKDGNTRIEQEATYRTIAYY
jgi:hypothetical protein